MMLPKRYVSGTFCVVVLKRSFTNCSFNFFAEVAELVDALL